MRRDWSELSLPLKAQVTESPGYPFTLKMGKPCKNNRLLKQFVDWLKITLFRLPARQNLENFRLFYLGNVAIVTGKTHFLIFYCRAINFRIIVWNNSWGCWWSSTGCGANCQKNEQNREFLLINWLVILKTEKSSWKFPKPGRPCVNQILFSSSFSRNSTDIYQMLLTESQSYE